MTRAELIEAVADELRLTSVGQSLAVEDSEKIDSKIDGVLADLAGRQVIYVGDADNVPDAAAEYLAVIIKDACASAFGQQRDPALRELMEEKLRVLVRKIPPTKATLKIDRALTGRANYTYDDWLWGR